MHAGLYVLFFFLVCRFSKYFVGISGNIEFRTSVGTTWTTYLVVSMFATLYIAKCLAYLSQDGR